MTSTIAPLILVATGNLHKVQEMRAGLSGEFRWMSLKDLPNKPELREDQATFEGNAQQKAMGLIEFIHPLPEWRNARGWILSDDSGLEVDALGGLPGVHSARYASQELGLPGNAPDAANNAKLLKALAEVKDTDRTARFRCVLALIPLGTPKAEAGSQTRFFSGACEGSIGRVARGAAGFGYDPLFYPAGMSQSFAELGEEVKMKLSHRAAALVALRLALFPSEPE